MEFANLNPNNFPIWQFCDCQVLRLQELHVLELQFVMCQQTMIKTLESRFRLLKVCVFVKLELSELYDLLAKSTRLDRSNIVQIVFSIEFLTQPKINKRYYKVMEFANLNPNNFPIWQFCDCQVLRIQELNVLELQFIMCWQTMIKTQSLDLGCSKCVYL